MYIYAWMYVGRRRPNVSFVWDSSTRMSRPGPAWGFNRAVSRLKDKHGTLEQLNPVQFAEYQFE